MNKPSFFARLRSILTGLLILLVLLVGFYYLHKSPKFQLSGELISHIETKEKVVALTFDDGPGNLAITTEVLDVLDTYEIKATFFLVGEAMEKNPESVEEIVQRGHELANHSYSHQMMLFRSQNWLEKEISQTDKLIRATGHTGEIYFRPPYGKKLLSLPWYLSEQDRITVTWDVDGDSKALAPDKISDNIENKVKPGSIILMHVLLNSRKGSREALPHSIKHLQEKGYSFLKLSEMLQR